MKSNYSKFNGLFLTLFMLSFFYNSVAQVPYGNNPEVGKYITLNGVKHYYEVYGSGAPLLLLHGNGTPTKGWAPQIEYFSKKYKVYSIDSRGRGKTEMGKDSLTFTRMASDMAVFIKEMKMDSVCVVGKSDGGIIAILMGIYHPGHIRKIVAFGANMWPDSTALYTETVEGMHAERVKAEEMLAAHDTTKNWLTERERYRLDEFQPHITAADLQKIKVPVLVMSTDRDVIREEHTLFIYRNIPNANLCILPNEKHGVSRLNPDLFNSTVDKYLSLPYKGNEMRFED
jgi:pimeloyl-ACP methyl ester carboxylesterase